jgi:hypothetical protein
MMSFAATSPRLRTPKIIEQRTVRAGVDADDGVAVRTRRAASWRGNVPMSTGGSYAPTGLDQLVTMATSAGQAVLEDDPQRTSRSDSKNQRSPDAAASRSATVANVGQRRCAAALGAGNGPRR